MNDFGANTRLTPQFDGLDSARHLMSLRTSREKVAILLAALSKETAVSLLQKLDPESIRTLFESSGSLGDLRNGDFEPVVEEFTVEFSEALGISAGSEQLIPLLEAAFTQEKVSEVLGIGRGIEKESIWTRFTANMDAVLVPYLLDEHEQTAAIVLSKLPAELSAKCFALLPRELTPRLLGRILTLRNVSEEMMNLLETTLEEQFFSSVVSSDTNKWIERVAAVVNRMEREQALGVLDSLAKEKPDLTAKLRRFIFMYEDIERMDPKSVAKLFDRAATELVTPSLWGMNKEFKEIVLTGLSARARRMVESELASDDGSKRNDTIPARKKIAELALGMSRRGEILLPTEADVKGSAKQNAA